MKDIIIFVKISPEELADLKKNYIVIMGDIVSSKQINNRAKVQDKLRDVLKDINLQYKASIASDFMISLGDEFQGLITSPKEIFNIIGDIEAKIAPVKIRFSVGIGTVATEVVATSSIEMDGTAYHRARQMLVELKEIEGQYTSPQTNILLKSHVKNMTVDGLINSLLASNFALKSKWTDRQVEVIQAYLNHNQNQYQTAAFLDIAQPNVSKSLSNAKFYTYISAIKAIEAFLVSEGEWADE